MDIADTLWELVEILAYTSVGVVIGAGLVQLFLRSGHGKISA